MNAPDLEIPEIHVAVDRCCAREEETNPGRGAGAARVLGFGGVPPGAAPKVVSVHTLRDGVWGSSARKHSARRGREARNFAGNPCWISSQPGASALFFGHDS